MTLRCFGLIFRRRLREGFLLHRLLLSLVLLLSLRPFLPRPLLLPLEAQHGERDDQIIGSHQLVLDDIAREPLTKIRFLFEIVEKGPVVTVRVRENTINPPGDGAKFLRRVLLDGHTRGEMLVAVEKGGGPVERVKSVIQRRALLGLPVSGAEEYPLLRRRHLLADERIALFKETDGERV